MSSDAEQTPRDPAKVAGTVSSPPNSEPQTICDGRGKDCRVGSGWVGPDAHTEECWKRKWLGQGLELLTCAPVEVVTVDLTISEAPP